MADDCLQGDASISQRCDSSSRASEFLQGFTSSLSDRVVFVYHSGRNELVDQLDRFRKKRNISAYAQPETVSDQEAAEIIKLAGEMRGLVRVSLAKQRADLL